MFLKGEKGAPRDIVVINSGAALYVAKLADSLEEGIKKASELIDSGVAYKKYEELTNNLKISNNRGDIF